MTDRQRRLTFGGSSVSVHPNSDFQRPGFSGLGFHLAEDVLHCDKLGVSVEGLEARVG
jgi:hypothetical protein